MFPAWPISRLAVACGTRPLDSAIRGLLKAAGPDVASELPGVLRRDDDYAAAGKPAL